MGAELTEVGWAEEERRRQEVKRICGGRSLKALIC